MRLSARRLQPHRPSRAQRHAEVSPLRSQAFIRHDPVWGRLQRLVLRRGFRPHATRTARTVKRKQRQQRQAAEQVWFVWYP